MLKGELEYFLFDCLSRDVRTYGAIMLELRKHARLKHMKGSYQQVDRALQRLRKSGKIQFNKGLKEWFKIDSEGKAVCE